MKTNEDEQELTRSIIVRADSNSLALPFGAGVMVVVAVALALFDPTVSPLRRLVWIDSSPVAKAVVCIAAGVIGIILLSLATRLALGAPLVATSGDTMCVITAFGYRTLHRGDIVEFCLSTHAGRSDSLLILRRAEESIKIVMKPRGRAWADVEPELTAWLAP